MVERLLLDRVDAEARRAAVGGEHHARRLRILRTKHRPRWPSCSLQSRGHRSHWMRPSSSAVPPATGVVSLRPLASPGSATSCSAPGACRPAARPCAASCAEKRALVGNAFPDLRQERGAACRRPRGSGRPRRHGSARSRSASSAKRSGLGAKAARPRRAHCGHSAALSAGKRGSRNAAASAFSRHVLRRAAASPRGCRCSRAARRPSVRVTNVAPACASHGASSRAAGLAEQLLLDGARARCASSVLPASSSGTSPPARRARRTNSRPRGPCRRRCRPSCRPQAACTRKIALASRRRSRPFSGVAPQASSWSMSVAKRRDARERRARRCARASRVGVVMRQVGGDHDQRLGAAPQALEHLGDLRDARRADGEAAPARNRRARVCRNGSCTSSACSSACAASLRTTCGSVAHARERRAVDAHACRAAWRRRRRSARRGRAPRTRCAGPSSTTRRTMPRAAASSS